MKRILFSMLTMSLFLVSAVLVEAQTQRVKKAIEKISLEGESPKAFVPKGWEIYSDATGDLNGDRVDDVALALGLPHEEREKMYERETDDYESPPYIVAVLFGKKDGGFRRFAVNGQLYPATGDAPMTVEIKKGALITNQNFRDGWAVDVTYRFRYEAAAKKLMLIGFDVEHYSRGNIYAGNKASENYLTGMRIEYAKEHDERKEPGYLETKRRRIKRARISFEEAVFSEESNEEITDMARPF